MSSGSGLATGRFFVLQLLLKQKNLTPIIYYAIDNKNQYRAVWVFMSSKTNTIYHHEELALRIADLTFTVLKTTSQALLLFCYNHSHLDQHLSHAGIRTLLHKAGNDKDTSCRPLLSELCRRIKKNDSFRTA